MILALDPGISAANATGVALFHPLLKRLVAADIIRRDPTLDDLLAQWDIANRAIEWAAQHLPESSSIGVFVTEWPQVYPNERKKDPNKAVLPLCGIIGAVSGLLDPGVRRITYLPRVWKGTVDGDAFTQRILDRLDGSERSIIDGILPASLRHNATDASGLGLFYLNRMGRLRIVHNAA